MTDSGTKELKMWYKCINNISYMDNRLSNHWKSEKVTVCYSMEEHRNLMLNKKKINCCMTSLILGTQNVILMEK